MTYFGIDPGTRNLGLAVRFVTPRGENEYLMLHHVGGVSQAVGAIYHWLTLHAPLIKSDAYVGVEDYAFFGMRKNFGPMKEVIGAVRGICLVLGYHFMLFQPREKEKVSHKLSRPEGQSDHAFDARCLARLTQEACAPCKGSAPSSSPETSSTPTTTQKWSRVSSSSSTKSSRKKSS